MAINGSIFSVNCSFQQCLFIMFIEKIGTRLSGRENFKSVSPMIMKRIIS